MSINTTQEMRETEICLAKHGGNVYAIAKKLHKLPSDFIDFSGTSHAFANSITTKLAQATPYPLEHYPDSDCLALRESLALHEGCKTEELLVGNGSAELIWPALTTLAPRKILFIGPLFSEYVRAAMLLGIEYDLLAPPDSREFLCGPAELRVMRESHADLAVLCTPNNPGAFTYPNIRELFDNLRIPRILIDNSYREFLFGQSDYAHNGYLAYAQNLAQTGVSVFSLNSFTPFFACPGLRLGYLVGDARSLARMAQRRPPWAVSPYAQDLGICFLEKISLYRDALHSLRRWRHEMTVNLRRNACFDTDYVFEGTSFLTAKLAHRAPANLAAEKLLRQGLIVRDCDTIPGMPKGYLRIQVRPERDIEVLFNALDWHAERGW
ncbi:aminotransferase [Deltaproteobacteria bacterium]|nr:aminotransferase [Deltaproteobacteria bacterium]